MLSCIFLPLLPPKCVKTREHKDEHCVSWCTPVHVTPYPRHL